MGKSSLFQKSPGKIACGKPAITLVLCLLPLFAWGGDCSQHVKALKLDPKKFSCMKNCMVGAPDVPPFSDDNGQDCFNACRNHCNSTVTFSLFFMNGILTDRGDAKYELTALSLAFQKEMLEKQPNILKQLTIEPKLAYNQTRGFIVDLATAAFQRLTGLEAEMFFVFLAHLNKAPPWFQKLVGDKFREIQDINHMANVLLRKSAQQILSDLYKAVSGPYPGAGIVVAHSQGNLYLSHLAPLLLAELIKDTSNYFHDFIESTQTIPNLTAVQTAVPGYQASGLNIAIHRDGLPGYFTLKSDGYMKALGPLALPPTIDNETGWFFDHSFLDDYICGKNSGPAIRRAMVLEACNTYLSLFDPDDHNDWWNVAQKDDEDYCVF